MFTNNIIIIIVYINNILFINFDKKKFNASKTNFENVLK